MHKHLLCASPPHAPIGGVKRLNKMSGVEQQMHNWNIAMLVVPPCARLFDWYRFRALLSPRAHGGLPEGGVKPGVGRGGGERGA